jgi:hypothetical protein
MTFAVDEKVATNSPESDIDRKAEALLGKIISGSATEKERARYRELSMQRSHLMTRPRTSRVPSLYKNDKKR